MTQWWTQCAEMYSVRLADGVVTNYPSGMRLGTAGVSLAHSLGELKTAHD